MNMQTSITFSPEQELGIEKAAEWFHSNIGERPVFQFTGFAGTGKTTCVKELIARLAIPSDRVLFGAYTGKAALVMKKLNDVDARTIHSLIYKLVPPERAVLEKLQREMDETDDVAEKRRISKDIEEKRKPRFILNDDSDLCSAKLLVLDECSMVNEEILKDLLSYNVPILALGDPGQLPPIEGTGALFVGKPDVMLTEIHRQAQGNPIIEAATSARNLQPWQYSYEGTPDDRFYMTAKSMLTDESYRGFVTGHDQILCGMHKTRRAVNLSYRRIKNLGGTDPYPVPGDRVICRRNYREEGLFNGLQAQVVSRGLQYDDFIEYEVLTEIGKEPQKVRMVRVPFDEYYNKDAKLGVHWSVYHKNHEFDFAYCLTVHVSQGSQWDSVLLIDDGFLKGWGRTREEKAERRIERGKWLYTAVTRAAEKFTCIA